VALDPAWIGVIGTGGGAVIGAFGSALVEWAKVATQGKQQRMADAERHQHEAAEARAQREHDAAEAKAVREADAAEKEAQRQHGEAQAQAQRDAAQRADRVEQVREWREGLAAAYTEYKTWYAKHHASDPKPASANYAPEPNIVSAPWFQSLRPHLSRAGKPGQLHSGNDIQCDDDVADTLGSEIASIEESWRLVD
jgi:uncharacterized membrane protein YccC